MCDFPTTLVELFDWVHPPLRCPHCGNRGGLRQPGFWVDVSVSLNGDGRPATLICPDYSRAALECGRCESSAPFAAFLPPWAALVDQPCRCRQPLCAAPLPLTAADRATEAAWALAAVEEHFLAQPADAGERPKTTNPDD